MSDTLPLHRVAPVAQKVIREISDVCDTAEIAGSVRRGAKFVKDVEIVAIPAGDNLLARLDKWVIEGRITRARYGADLQYRWGDKYRGFVVQGIRFEIFLTTPEAFGYIHWLRTGPGDANTYVMTQLKMSGCPLRATDGAIWHEDRQLIVADEREMFRLLGMPYIAPDNRTIQRYRQHLSRPMYPLPETFHYAKPRQMKQQSLF